MKTRIIPAIASEKNAMKCDCTLTCRICHGSGYIRVVTESELRRERKNAKAIREMQEI